MLSAQERISILDDQLVFYVPDGTLREYPRREFSSYEEEKEYFGNKIGIWVAISQGATITPESWKMSSEVADLVQKRRVKQQDFLTLLSASRGKMAFAAKDDYLKIGAGYAYFKYNGIIVGEVYGIDGSIDEVAPPYHGYLIYLVVGDNIVHLRLNLHDENGNIAKQMPEYFYYENKVYNDYVWRDFYKSRGDLYEKLYSDRYIELPSGFQKLRETLDMVLDTITIPGYGSSEAYVTEVTLRLRSDANTSSEIITVLPANTKVRIIEEGKVQILDRIAARWVKVETEEGKQGWCFSGYLGVAE
jgi:uncharacterized protein YgiM (DUF1202 family)